MANLSIKGNQNTTDLLQKLKSSATQYPELTKEQEREMIEQYRHDREKLNKLLFMHNIRYVFNTAKKYSLKTNDFDGMVQDGMVGLGEACKRFDLDRGTKFITYAVPWVRKYILANFYGKNVEVEMNSISLQTPNMFAAQKANPGNEVTFEQTVNEYLDPSCVMEQTADVGLSAAEQADICNGLFAKLDEDTSLSATDKAVFKEVVFDQEKPRLVASKYGVTMHAVNQIKNTVLAKFKEILTSEYGITSYADLALVN